MAANKTVVAGELYETITGQLFEIGRQLRQKSGYPYDPRSLKQLLQSAIEGRFPMPSYELYLSPAQQQTGGSIKWVDLQSHLKETKLYDRTFSFEDSLVQSWLANPSSYPEELRGKAVLLCKSQQDSGGGHDCVIYLDWFYDGVVARWTSPEGRLDGCCPILLVRS